MLYYKRIVLCFCSFNLLKSVFCGDDELIESGNVSLFNISEDPYETSDLIDNDAYTKTIKTLEERRHYWNDLTVAANSPDDSNKTSGWTTCGRVCPWINSDYSTLEVEQIYSYDKAPHIVFVLVDDWGYNDFGKRSTYLSWTTPTIDSLADEGILLENYYTNELCGPSRASLLTGRYSLRLGVEKSTDELYTSETLLAAELKSAGYRTYAVGKWHLGLSEYKYLPTQRGFDYFYGYLNGFESYYTKEYLGYVDLWENNNMVTNEVELDSSYHSGWLYETKAEDVIRDHATFHSDTPMFLYYPMHLVHYPWTAPETYVQRCSSIETDSDNDGSTSDDYTTINYCAMNVMMDEAIANLTCTLNQYGFSDNTILIISGDNGGESTISGSNYPYRGSKATLMRGAFANTAIIHSKLIPSERRGGSYDYNFHITDWYPTLMNLATGGEWTGGYNGQDIDGYDMWDNLIDNAESDRTEMVFVSHSDSIFSMQYGDMKYIYHSNVVPGSTPDDVFASDLDPTASFMSCDNPSFVHVDSMYDTLSNVFGYGPSKPAKSQLTMTFMLFAFIATMMILCIGMLMTYRTTMVSDPKNVGIYVAYKDGSSGENVPLIDKL